MREVGVGRRKEDETKEEGRGKEKQRREPEKQELHLISDNYK